MRAEREIVEVLSQLTPHGPSISSPGRGGRGPRLTPGEVAAMLAGVDRPVMCLAYAKYTLDPQAHDELVGWLRVEALQARKRQGWDIDPGDRRFSALAVLVRDDLVLSRPTPSRRKGASVLGVSERAWRQVWADRYATLLNIGHGWHSALTYALARQLRGG